MFRNGNNTDESCAYATTIDAPTYAVSWALAERQVTTGHDLVLPFVAEPFRIETRRLGEISRIDMETAQCDIDWCSFLDSYLRVGQLQHF